MTRIWGKILTEMFEKLELICDKKIVFLEVSTKAAFFPYGGHMR